MDSKRINFSVRMTPAMHRQLKILAIKKGITLSDLIEKVCNDCLINQEKHDQKIA
jgi:predicted HicB family RNase H-like nuclease